MKFSNPLAGLRLALITFALLALGACGEQQNSSAPQAGVDANTAAAGAATGVVINKSPNDDRDYRYLVLDNQLRVLLVTDPSTDKAAASLTVLRGSFHEPEAYPGLAHFLEHMLFIGTKKYPEVDGYQQFVATHGGSSNAYTAGEHTNYFFDIHPDQFAAGMDRFAQFFISPLLDPAYVDREKNAVHSEYQLQIKDDGWRGQAATKAAMNPEYPGARFNIGNLDTLGEGVGPALNEFFASEYSADQMVLVALSNESLDSMEAWVRPLFSAIENRSLGSAPNSIKAFNDKQLPAVLSYQTLKDEYRLAFNFPVPATETFYRKKPANYLTNLLGHEGLGSLHHLLKDKGWIASLGAGTSRLDDTNAYISINMELTESGRESINEITQALFGYIKLLNSSDPEAWRYDEQALVADLGFRFQEQSSATAFVYQIAPALALYPPEDVLAAPYLMEEFDPELIRSYLAYLTPDNVITTISGPTIEGDRTDPWFKVPFKLEQRRLADAPATTAEMHLPDPNPFLPEDLTLLPADEHGPALALEKPGLALWLDSDAEFGVPRANQNFTLGVRGGFTTPEDIATARLYQRLVVDSLTDYAYPALMAGLGYQLNVTPAGFRLSLSGYADQQAELMDTVLERFVTLEVDPERFARYRSELARDWRNFKNERPYSQTYAALGNLLVSSSWSPDALSEAIEAVTLESLAGWRKRRLNEISVLGLGHGNVSMTDLQAMAGLLNAHLKLVDFPISKPEIVDVAQALRLELDIDHNDASMILYVQDPDSSIAQRARGALAAQILRQQYFSALRTDQQLGYVVAVNNRTMRDRGGLTFIIQSPVASPARLEAATRAFMDEQLPFLDAMSEAEFAQQQAGLVNRLTERDKNLRERSARYWGDLDLDVITFDLRQQIANAAAGLSKADVRAYLVGVIDRLQSARVLVYNQGKFSDAPPAGEKLSGPAAFKASAAAAISPPPPVDTAAGSG